MLRSTQKPMLLLMWLARITTAVSCWRVWVQLAAPMAVDSGANFEPDGRTWSLAAAQPGFHLNRPAPHPPPVNITVPRQGCATTVFQLYS
jgi:hypothetical protein